MVSLSLLIGVLALALLPPPQTPTQRIGERQFPSVFQAWSPAQHLTGETSSTTEARHDLYFSSPEAFGLRWSQKQIGLSTRFTPESIIEGRKRRSELLKLNPKMVLLAEIRYRDAYKDYLPETSLFWKRDKNGKRMIGWEEGGYYLLDLANPDFQLMVADQAKVALASGVVDGVMLDWWIDDADRLALIKKVRAAVGEDALILVNANDRTTPLTAGYVNGYFMECYRSKTSADWRRIAETLEWAETHTRQPRINCLETWYAQSRQDLDRMRATTTLSLGASNGYCLFSDPNDLPTEDHSHDWYPFWGKSLGKPTTSGKWQQDGSLRREFQQGTSVYNPMGNQTVTVTFEKTRKSAATGKRAKTFQLSALDGDLYLK